jgi:Sec-independent protein translocase protein TatA
MTPLEIAITAGVALLLGGYRLLPKWGSALGETVGILDRNSER